MTTLPVTVYPIVFTSDCGLWQLAFDDQGHYKLLVKPSTEPTTEE